MNLAPAESIQQGYLLSRYGVVIYSEKGDVDKARKSFEKAMSTALDNEDVALEMQVLNEMTKLYEAQHRFKESLDSALRVIDLSRQVDLSAYEFNPHIKAVNAYIALGDLDSAGPHSKALLEHTERYPPSTSNLGYTLLLNDLVARLSGAYSEARQFNDQGLANSPKDCRLLYSRTLLEFQMGEFSQGEVYLERLLDVLRSSPPGPTLEYALVPPVIGLVPFITGDTNRLDMMESMARDMLAMPRATSHVYWFSQITLALLAIQRGDTDEALKYYTTLKSYPHPMHGWGTIASNRLLGLLSATTGDVDRSATHFENAVISCRDGGYLPELAWVCYDYANCLLNRNNPGDRDKAASLLNDSLSISIELGMKPLTERSSVLKEQIEAADSPHSAPKYPKGLTEREVEVLMLASQGRTNGEIAEELFISIRTVQNHIRNIYNKIEVRNRSEATAFALNHLSTRE